MTQTTINDDSILFDKLKNAKGEIPYTFINDYMFRVILQKHIRVLKSIVCACLNLNKEDIIEITIQNPIKLGEAIDDKTFILDINVLLNSNTVINLEMQVLDLNDWPERSLSYLSRSYDNVAKGCDYIDVKPVYHIGFLNYTLFPEYPEFFAKYQLLNVKNHNVYTSKFNLYVIDLTRTDLATDEDEKSGLLHWIRIFKAKTWEELSQMAEMQQEFREAAEALYLYNQDEVVKQQCRARQDYYNHEQATKKKIEEARIALEEARIALEEKDTALKEKDTALKEKDTALKEKDTALSTSVKLLAESMGISEREAYEIIGIKHM